MAGISIDAGEVRALAMDLSGAPARIQAKAPIVLRKGFSDMEAMAKSIAPVDTGYLKSTIDSRVTGLIGVLRATARYARYVEDGTSKMAAQPFLTPAFDAYAPSILDALGDAGEETVL